MRKIRTLIVDDDRLARKRIRGLLQKNEEVEIVAEGNGGREGIAAIRSYRPDLVFLDVQMPDLDGFGLIEEVGADEMPVVIFVSAFVEHALRAFEAYALDYLLKPFDDERFDAALQRAKQQLQMREPALDERMAGLLEFLREPAPTRYPEVLAIKSGEQYPLVNVNEIDWIEADGNYARLHLKTSDRLISKTLTELERNVLDPEKFVRIHRSTIVNLSRIATVEPLFHGEYSVHLKSGARLVCSRRFRHQLRARIYFTS